MDIGKIKHIFIGLLGRSTITKIELYAICIFFVGVAILEYLR